MTNKTISSTYSNTRPIASRGSNLGVDKVDILCVGAELGGHNPIPGGRVGAGGRQQVSLRLAHITHPQATKDLH